MTRKLEDRLQVTQPSPLDARTDFGRRYTVRDLLYVLPNGRAVLDILEERERQESLKAQGRFEYSCADSELADMAKVAVIGEEYGEVCRAALERAKLSHDPHFEDADGALRTELVQVAACALAWIQCIDREWSERNLPRRGTNHHEIGKLTRYDRTRDDCKKEGDG